MDGIKNRETVTIISHKKRIMKYLKRSTALLLAILVIISSMSMNPAMFEVAFASDIQNTEDVEETGDEVFSETVSDSSESEIDYGDAENNDVDNGSLSNEEQEETDKPLYDSEGESLDTEKNVSDMPEKIDESSEIDSEVNKEQEENDQNVQDERVKNEDTADVLNEDSETTLPAVQKEVGDDSDISPDNTDEDDDYSDAFSEEQDNTYVPLETEETETTDETNLEETNENVSSDSIRSGYCGDNVQWNLFADGKLCISGEGEMYNYASKASPFYMMDQILSITIVDGVSTIGENAFNGCNFLTSINIPASISVIGTGAFTDCSELKGFYFSGTQEEWNNIEGGDVYLTLEANLYVAENPSPVAVPIDRCEISEFVQQIYSGNEIYQDISVEYGDNKLLENNDYRIEYSDNTNAGTATVTITGMGYYTGSIEKTFEILPKEIVPTISLSKSSFVYNGKIQKPIVTVKDGDSELSNSDYLITFDSDSENVGSYTVSVDLKDNYFGSASASYVITAKKITPIVTLSSSSFIFNGKVQKPNVIVKDGSLTLSSADYSLMFDSGLKNAGKYNIKVKLKGNYSGSKVTAYTINPRTITPNVTLSSTSYVFNGTVRRPAVTVKYGKTKLSAANYTVVYPTGRKNVGIYRITVKLKNNYTGSKTVSFKITPKKVTPRVRLSNNRYVYNGTIRKPVVTVMIGSTVLSSANYKLSWSRGLQNVGTYRVYVRLTNNYSGSKVMSYRINPQPTSIRRAVGYKNQLTVMWDKRSRQVTGYQIQCSLNSSFTSGNKLITVAGADNTTKSFKKPIAGKHYFVRVRTYKKVGKTTYYSSWSTGIATAVKQTIKSKGKVILGAPSESYYPDGVYRPTQTQFTFTTKNCMTFYIPIKVTAEDYISEGGFRVILKNSSGAIIQNDFISLKGYDYGDYYEGWFWNDGLIIGPGEYTYIIRNSADSRISVEYSILSYLRIANTATIKSNVSVKSGYWVKIGKLGEGSPLIKTTECSNTSVVTNYEIDTDGTIWLYGNKKGNAKVTFTLHGGKKYTCNVNVTAGNPDFFAYLSGYYTRDNYFEVKVKNLRSSPLIIIRKGAKVEDVDYKSYDRKIKSADKITVKAGETKYIRFYVDGSNTWPDVDDYTLCAKIEFEGITYDWHVWYNDSVFKKDGGWYKTYWNDDAYSNWN